MQQIKKALIVIDVQNDYFPNGKLPLWNTGAALKNTVLAIAKARESGIAVILVQHVAAPEQGVGSFFVDGTEGVKIHADILKAAPGAPVVTKRFADSFKETGLNELLDSMGTEEIIVCGMQTQNCVGLTAISKHASKYKTSILADCCTAPMEIVHRLALAGFGDIVPLTDIAHMA